MGLFKRRAQQATATTPSVPPGSSILVLDFETSGFSPQQGDRVTWMGAVRLDPNGDWQLHSVAVEGTNGLAVFGDAPRSVQRVSRKAMVTWLADEIANAAAVVAHNAAFDERFARAEFETVDQDFPETPWLDTVQLARTLRPGWPDYKLATCVAQLGLRIDGQHEALADALACAHLFIALRADDVGGARDLATLLSIGGTQQQSKSPSRSSSRRSDFTVEIEISIEQDADGHFYVVGPDLPMCGDLYEKDLTDPRHIAAHEGVIGVGYDATREQRIATLRELVASGCPNACQDWAQLPYHYGSGSKARYDGAVFVLEQFREHGFASRTSVERVSRSLLYGPNELATYPKLMLKAWRNLGPWLSTFAPCDSCIEGQYYCTHLDLAMTTASAVDGDVEPWIPIVEAVGVETFLTDAGLVKQIPAGAGRDALMVLHEFRPAAPRAWSHLVTVTGQRFEKSGNIETAIELFTQAIATGEAPVLAYDRLSLIRERAKDFPMAAQVARDGVARAMTMRRGWELLEKRAVRCEAKAGRL